MKRTIYTIGCLLLFLGMLWLFLPHAAHAHVGEALNEQVDEETVGTHIENIIFGLIGIFSGLTLIIQSNNEKLQRIKIRPLLLLTATLSIATGLIHATYIRAHFAEWYLYGWFFITAAMLQIIYGIILIIGARGKKRIKRKTIMTYYWTAIIGNILIITLYIITRTIGIPLGPQAGVAEGVGVIDIISKILEVGIIIYTAILIKETNRIE
ncbi:MAG: hypothetical protein AABW73_00040 [Nanoarchaeota archaeon]